MDYTETVIGVLADEFVKPLDVIMRFRLALVATVTVALLAQVANEPNLARKRYRALSENSAAPLADVLKAADEWLSAYEKAGPGPQTLPPYLDIARFYAARSVRGADVLPLLEKAVAEIGSPGSFTQARAHGNSPFFDDFQRAFAADGYTQIGRYDKARELLGPPAETVSRTDAATLAPPKVRIFAALRFQYHDSLVRLAVAEGRKEEALELERMILSDAGRAVIAPRLLDEHKQQARLLWSELGRPPADFDSWLASAAK